MTDEIKATFSVSYSPVIGVAIDGVMQTSQSFVSVGQSYEDEDGPGMRPINRIEVGWLVPDTGLDFDGRPHVGTDRTFDVVAFMFGHDKPPPIGELSAETSTGTVVAHHRKMSLRSFTVSQKFGKFAYARAVFVCDEAEVKLACP